MNAPANAPPVPCGSCPYRRDVPSGIWAEDEYDKLIAYDGDTSGQSPQLFMCHQRDGNLCGGWLACHDPYELLAVRLALAFGAVEESVLDYRTSVPVFPTAAAARAHGMRDIERPGDKADRMIEGLVRKRKATWKDG